MDFLPSYSKPVEVREVWEKNLEYEFFLIRSIIKDYRYVAIDTEFPGDLFRPRLENRTKFSDLSPEYVYSFLKSNVDALKLIQLGLTLSDQDGNLPDFGYPASCIWQFNFREFDVDNDKQNTSSIELLKSQGIDFVTNKHHGVRAEQFSRLFLECFVPNQHDSDPHKFTWVTFHGAYDFGYLIKVLIRSDLPSDLIEFINLMYRYFGISMYDMKVMMKYFGLYGGLEKMATCLNIDRVAGKSHQAGSDSLLTMQVFMKVKDMYFSGENFTALSQYICMPYGLNLEANSENHV